MTTIKLHNTKTRKKEVFAPISADDVRMYVCGPTVYDRAHIGNARPVIVFDVLYRLLRHVYGADKVTYVRNFTDVDDKINARAVESGRSIGEITAEATLWFLDDMAAVGALEPSLKGTRHQEAMPRATAYIAPMVALIEDLIAKGHAYVAEDHVLFRVRSYENYGALSGRSVDDMIAGAQDRWRTSVAGFEDALKVPAGVVGNIKTARTEMQALVGRSQAATGALQATQAGNQLLALQSQQISDLTAAIAAQNRAQSLEAARVATAEAQARENLTRFLDYGSGYEPTTVRMFR